MNAFHLVTNQLTLTDKLCVLCAAGFILPMPPASLEIFRRPVSCVPCGHTYCLSCLEATEAEGAYSCEECSGAPVGAFVHNLPMEGLCTKYEYKLMALKSLQKMLKAPGRPPSK